MSLPTGRARLRRRAGLLAIALLHLAVLLTWRHGRPWHAPLAQHEGQLVFIDNPLPHPPPIPPRPLPIRPGHRASPAATPATTVHTEPDMTVPAPITAPAFDPLALPPPAKAADSVRERARLAVAGVDRQLRRESLNKYAVAVQEQGAMAKALSGAYVGDDTPVLVQQVQMIDGRSMKRFRANGREYCEYTNLVGAAGQDPFRDGGKTKVMTCP